MKRFLSLAAMFLCCVAISFAQFSGSGSGTENDPYLILNPIHLSQMRNFLNQKGVYFKLMANIDVSEFIDDEWPTQGWMPVGNSSSQFKGVLDGNGKTISGLTINRENMNFVGLFGDTEYATIKNLTLKGNVKGRDNVGGIAGDLQYGTISNCTFEGKIVGNSRVGGLIGGANGFLTDCISKAEVTGTGNYIGGIVGYYGKLTNCVASDAIVNGHDYVGGIAGCSHEMTGCNFSGDVNGNSYVGGICGKTESNVTSCYAVAHVNASGNQVGGLIGEVRGFIEVVNNLRDSYFSGTISGNEQVGGLVGKHSRGEIKKCYANAIISGTKAIGGLVGIYLGGTYYENYSYLTANVAICTFIKATIGNVGRIYGERSSDAIIGAMGTKDENKAWNRAIVVNAGVSQDVPDDLQNGTGVSATTLKLRATYVGMGWDFTDTWDIQETECYPYMKTQTAPPVITSKVVSGATTISGKCVGGGIVTLELDGEKQETVSNGDNFSFIVSPLQAGHEVRISAKAEGKESSYYTTETVAYLGKGTEDDPFQIYTAADLTGVYRKGYFKLMNDIDLTNYINQFSPTEGWESIGRDGSETIHFDGDGHKITGLWCNSIRDNTGLFSCFANGSIKNLTIETANDKQVKGGNNTGILIGKMINGTIENCHVMGVLADGTPVGGLVGLFNGGEIVQCQANVSITTTLSTSYVGGLVGEMNDGKIDECVTTGKLIATGAESYVGGLVGKSSANITNCYSNARVTSSYNAAGLVAYNYGIVDKCYATGGLQSNNYAAGIIGYNDGANAVIRNCVAMNKKIEVMYESQQQQQSGGYGQRIIGGIKNGAPVPEMNNYALNTMQVSVNNLAQKVYDDIMNGTAKTIEALMGQSTYASLGWNFIDNWSIIEGKGYPTLKNIGEISGIFGTYKLIYVIDGKEYKTEEIECGEEVTPIDTPTKEGYTFSGWSEMPKTMPAHDVTVSGTFTINKYKLSYIVDGADYKSSEIEYGAKITPEDVPTKEGYTFGGWSEIPETMPAHDVTVSGRFTINKYKVTYIVDGVEYKSSLLEYGSVITPEAYPKKEGYSFNGWSEIPKTVPSHDVTITGSFSINKYKLTYKVDDVEYKTIEVEYGASLPTIEEPTKTGYTFTGWVGLPKTMPASDVIVIGSFSINSYKLTYVLDGVEYKTATIEYGKTISPESVPTKEGYSFSGWSGLPETMPANDVTVTGSYTINKYKILYIVDGVEYGTSEIEYGAEVNPIGEPRKEGYTFSGWLDLPEEMPAHDVTVSGTFTVNKYKVTFMYGDNVLTTIEVNYGEAIELPESLNSERYTLIEWKDVPESMPAHDVVIYADYVDGINTITADSKNEQYIRINGMYTNDMKRGVNIIRTQDGKTRKVWVK